jgi:hypothetical protein
MSKPDQWVIITIGLLILLHLSVLAIGYFTARFAYLSAVQNAAAGVSIILYWAIRQLQIEQHTIETRELIVLLFEVVVIAAAVFYIGTSQRDSWLRVMQYIFFGIHLLALVLGLIFMLTFKMNKLM